MRTQQGYRTSSLLPSYLPRYLGTMKITCSFEPPRQSTLLHLQISEYPIANSTRSARKAQAIYRVTL